MASGVALRPEPFGALAYDFGTRRLTFLKSPKLADVVAGLADHGTAREACTSAGVADDEMAALGTALAELAAKKLIKSSTRG